MHSPLDRHKARAGEVQKLVNAYHRVFDSEDGLIVFGDIVDKFKMNESAFQIGPDGKMDPILAAYKDGSRAVYLHIVTQLNFEVIGDINAAEEAGPKVIHE